MSAEPIEVTGRTCVEFVALLRSRGLAIGPEQTTAFYASLHLLERVGLRELYWAGRVVLANQREQYPIYTAAFAEFFGPPAEDDHGLPAPPRDVAHILRHAALCGAFPGVAESRPSRSSARASAAAGPLEP